MTRQRKEGIATLLGMLIAIILVATIINLTGRKPDLPAHVEILDSMFAARDLKQRYEDSTRKYEQEAIRLEKAYDAALADERVRDSLRAVYRKQLGGDVRK